MRYGNRAGMETATAGAGTITLGAAVSKHQTFANAGIQNGDTVPYFIEDGNAWEIGTGVYSSTGPTLTRVLVESSTGSLLTLSGAAQVYIDAQASFFNADSGREVLSANRTYYVRTDGSDSNNGLANTSGGAFLTIQKAYNVIAMLDLGGFIATIQIGDGTYTAGLSIAVSPVGGNVAIVGNTGTPGNVIISTTAARAIAVTSGINLSLSGVKLQTTTSADSLYVEGAGANVTLGAGMQFGASADSQINVNRNGLVIFTAAYTINGSATTNHCRVQQGGQISGSTITATLTGTPSFANTFSVESTGVFTMFSWTFSGSATGPRYAVSGNGVLNSFGSGTASTFFPGNANGTTASGGQQI